jgi:hypothetical protein
MMTIPGFAPASMIYVNLAEGIDGEMLAKCGVQRGGEFDLRSKG